jgi:hypothetical protein
MGATHPEAALDMRLQQQVEDEIRCARRAHRAKLFKTVIVALFVCAFARPAVAACSGSSPNRTAASASRTDVNDCITAASSGDTIRVPAGSASWGSPIALPATKDLTLLGASVITCSGTPITCSAQNNTIITCATCFDLNLNASQRISGFTMLGANNGGIGSTNNQNINEHFRVDHNRIVSNAGWAPLEIQGQSNAVHPQGIVDNNILVDISIHANGTSYQLDEGNQQHLLWAQQTPLGDSTAIVYIEDNHFQNTSANINNADANYGGRYVYRFNNTTSGRQTVEVHSVQGDNRASQRWEIYKNSGSNGTGFSGTAFIRGGSGVAFGNRLTGSWSFNILMDNVRSEGSVTGAGRCNGTSAWDQNAVSGYRCRDQIGSAYDTTLWDHNPPGPYSQAFRPAYFWDNLSGSAQFAIDNSGLSTWLAGNRDWYTTDTTFTGTTGVGEGTLANRPSTCTTGVAYWATDQGEWNSRKAGPDGRLYRCTASNTWTLYYTPYPYPHPWQGAGPTAPAPPTNLRIIATLLFGLPWLGGACIVNWRRRSSL